MANSQNFNARAFSISLEDFAQQTGGRQSLHGRGGLEKDQISLFTSLASSLTPLLAGKDHLYSLGEVTARAIGFHTTKKEGRENDILPVVEYTLPSSLGKVVMSDDYDTMIISFELAKPLPRDTFGRVGYFRPEHKMEAKHFPEGRAHGPFSEDQQNFTLAMPSAYFNDTNVRHVLTGAVLIASNPAPKAEPGTKPAEKKPTSP